MVIVYVLYSKVKDKFLVGFTETLEETIQKHNSKGFGGGQGDWQLVHQEFFADKKNAEKRTREIKYKKDKDKIAQLINYNQSTKSTGSF